MPRHRDVKKYIREEEHNEEVDANDNAQDGEEQEEEDYRYLFERIPCDMESTSGQGPRDQKSMEEIRLISCLSELEKHVGNKVPKSRLITIVVNHNFDFEASLNQALICATGCEGPRGAFVSPTDEIVNKAKFLSCVEEIQRHLGNAIPPHVINAVVKKNHSDFEMSLKEALIIATSTPEEIKKIRYIFAGSRKPPEGVETLDTAVSKMSLGESSKNGQKEMASNKLNEGAGTSKSFLSEKKQNLYVVVVGHVDTGKSTLVGHLMFKIGEVDKKLMHKFEQESKKIGKHSFQYAWVLDETNEERSRGITMDVGRRKFEIGEKTVLFLDAPGHKDFIPNMIAGATQADAAMLVVDATPNEFETGFGAGGQTREHALLIRSLGIVQLIVVINKMDVVGWAKERFDEISNELRTFLFKIGFKGTDVSFIPCSGLRGENLTTKPQSSDHGGWYNADSLLDAIKKLAVPERLKDYPLRMSVSDVVKGLNTIVCVSGRLECGTLSVGDKVMIQPGGQICVVKGLMVDERSDVTVEAGDAVHVKLGREGSSVCIGHVLCSPVYPVPISRKFEAKIVVFNTVAPITVGSMTMMHAHFGEYAVVFHKLLVTLNKSTGAVLKTKPRMLNKNCSAMVIMKLNSHPICMELHHDVKELGRFMLRVDGVTIAAGLITEIL